MSRYYRIITLSATLALVAAAVLALSALAGTGVEAAKGGKVTLTIVELGGGNPYNFGENLAFAASGGIDGDEWVVNQCFQTGELVYSESHVVADGVAGPFTLGPTHNWTGGAADCVAQVWDTFRSARPVNGASVPYHVDP